MAADNKLNVLLQHHNIILEKLKEQTKKQRQRDEELAFEKAQNLQLKRELDWMEKQLQLTADCHRLELAEQKEQLVLVANGLNRRIEVANQKMGQLQIDNVEKTVQLDEVDKQVKEKMKQAEKVTRRLVQVEKVHQSFKNQVKAAKRIKKQLVAELGLEDVEN